MTRFTELATCFSILQLSCKNLTFPKMKFFVYHSTLCHLLRFFCMISFRPPKSHLMRRVTTCVIWIWLVWFICQRSGLTEDLIPPRTTSSVDVYFSVLAWDFLPLLLTLSNIQNVIVKCISSFLVYRDIFIYMTDSYHPDVYAWLPS